VTAFRITAPGIFPEVDPNDYHADPCPTPSLSHGIACTILDHSLEHAWVEHPRLNPNYERSEEKKFDLGNVAHALFLGRGKRLAVAPFDDWRTKAAKEFREQAIAQGLQPVKEKDHDRALAMSNACKIALDRYPDEDGVPLISEFHGGAAEVMLAWRARRRLAANADRLVAATSARDLRLQDDVIVDRAGRARPHDVDRQLAHASGVSRARPRGARSEVRRPAQAPFHRARVLRAVRGAGRGDPGRRAHDRQEASRERNAKWRDAMAIGTHREAFACYPRAMVYPHIPEWAENKWLAREIAEFEDRKRSLNEPMLTSVAGG
jgi:hypothetical protein